MKKMSTRGSRTQVNKQQKNILIAVSIIAIVSVSLVIIGFAANATSTSNGGTFWNPQVEYVSTRLDESVLADGTGIFTPYRQVDALATAQGITVLWNGASGTIARKITSDEVEIANRLEISASDLYCSNGTAKVFYGTLLYAIPAEYAIIFKLGGSWHIYIGISTDNIGKWVSAVISQLWMEVFDPAGWWNDVKTPNTSYPAQVLPVAFALQTWPAYMATSNGRGGPYSDGSYLSMYVISQANVEAKLGDLHLYSMTETARLYTHFVSSDGRAAVVYGGLGDMYLYIRV